MVAIKCDVLGLCDPSHTFLGGSLSNHNSIYFWVGMHRIMPLLLNVSYVNSCFVLFWNCSGICNVCCHESSSKFSLLLTLLFHLSFHIFAFFFFLPILFVSFPDFPFILHWFVLVVKKFFSIVCEFCHFSFICSFRVTPENLHYIIHNVSLHVFWISALRD